MIFLEYVGSRACLSAEIKTSPVKSTFYGTFSFYPVTTERHTNRYLQNRKCRSHKDSLKKSLLFILILTALSFLCNPKHSIR